MKSFRIENLKSFKDSGRIEIKPINVVLGKNSSGKSTLLRTFPLIKQTLERQTSDPILWYGDYVDFGDYNNAINDDNRENGIKFSFEFAFQKRRWGSFEPKTAVNLSLFIKNNNLNIFIIMVDNNTIILEKKRTRYSIKLNGIEIPHNNITFNNNRVSAILPTPYYQYKNEIYSLFSFYSARDRIAEIYGKDKEKLDHFKNFDYNILDYDEIVKKISEIEVDLSKIKKIANEFILANIANLIYRINEEFEIQFNNIHYIEPIRVYIDRYYRIQGLKNDAVNSNGDNVALILRKLKNENRLKNFEKWCSDNFKFQFTINEEHQNISILVSADSKEHNIVDSGFGYSQILPIIMQLYLMDSSQDENMMIIEQPELHLHPSLQSALVDAIVSIQNKNSKCKFMIETHSESIINSLANYVIDEKDFNDKINLIIVEKKDGESMVRNTRFTEDGLLEEWPTGFFSVGKRNDN